MTNRKAISVGLLALLTLLAEAHAQERAAPHLPAVPAGPTRFQVIGPKTAIAWKDNEKPSKDNPEPFRLWRVDIADEPKWIPLPVPAQLRSFWDNSGCSAIGTFTGGVFRFFWEQTRIPNKIRTNS